MVNYRRKWIRAVAVCTALGASLSACDEKKTDVAPTPGPSATGSSAPLATGSGSAARSAPVRNNALDAGVPASSEIFSQLPGIDELFAQAQAAGVGKSLYESIKPKSKAFAKMGPAERPVEVGMFLADVAIASGDPNKDVATSLLEDSERAIASLSPPAKVTRLMSEGVAEVKKGLKGAELRRLVDRMIAQAVPLLEQDVNLQQTGRLVRLGAYLRTMGRVAGVLAKQPDPKAFGVLAQDRDNEFHLKTIDALPPEMKKEPLLTKAADALKAMAPIVAKASQNQDDAKAIASATATFY